MIKKLKTVFSQVKNMIDLPLIGVLFAIGGILLSYLIQKKEKNDNERDRRAQSHLITDQAKEIKKLTQEAIDRQTGGDSYCYFTFMENTDEGTQSLYLHHVGKYPIRDLHICIGNERGEVIDSFTIDIIAPNDEDGSANTRYLRDVPFTQADDIINWGITFQPNNGQRKWYQRVIFSSYQKNFPDFIKTDNYKYPGIVHSQVFRIKEDIEPTYFSLSDQTEKRRGMDRSIYTQQILDETHTIFRDFAKTLDWTKYRFVSCNIAMGFNKVVHLNKEKKEH